MNVSRRNLLLGASAAAIAPALPVPALPVPAWTPQPWAFAAKTQTLDSEIFYGGARGGGKMFGQMSASVLQRWFDDYTTFGRAVTRINRDGIVTNEDPFIIIDEATTITEE